MMDEILVKKRSGEFEAFDANKVNKIIKWACEGVRDVSENEIGVAFSANIKNKISTEEIHKSLISSTVGLINEANPNYEIVAANLLNYELRKEVWGGSKPIKFYDLIKKNTLRKSYTKELLQWFSKEEIDELEKHIDHDRDFLFKYSGLSQVIDKYLIKNVISKEVYETPSFAYMLIAMTLFHKEKHFILDAYNSFSLHKISLPTPIFAGVRTNLKSFASCLLLDIGDSINEISTGFEVIAKATAKRYGIGANMTKMRPIGSPIRGGENVHTGKVGFLRIIQDTIKAWLQGSTRSGAATVTVPIWDYEIEEILQLKDVMRPPENRVGDIDYLIAFSDLFYQRYVKNEQITLFNPHECPELEQNFGLPEFDSLYLEAEKNPKIKMKKQVNARDLFDLFNKFRLETGRYYVLNIDEANSHGSFKDRLAMSNLCVEVIHPVSPLQNINDEQGSVGICILSAINILNIKSDEDLKNNCDIAVRMLDNLIDYQEYFSAAAFNFATKYRSLGIGITNFAAWLAKKGLKYSSQEAREEAHSFFEKFQYYLLSASNNLAVEKGACEWFHKTKYSDGILPIDTYNKKVDEIVKNNLKLDWELLRERIKTFGLRHATLTAQMPCEASALCTNSTNGIERPRSPFLIKSNKSKDFPIIIPNFKRWKYEYCFENKDNIDHIWMMALLQKFCDMSISANLFYNYSLFPDGKIPSSIIIKDLFEAKKRGLKTIYYTNSDDGNVHNLSDAAGCESGACAI